MADVKADIGVIGGSGLYQLGGEAESVRIDTPFGAPSSEGFNPSSLAKLEQTLGRDCEKNAANLWSTFPN